MYVDTGHGMYLMMSIEEDVIELLIHNIVNELWSMEFDGNSSSFGSGVGIVLILPKGEKFLKA